MDDGEIHGLRACRRFSASPDVRRLRSRQRPTVTSAWKVAHTPVHPQEAAHVGHEAAITQRNFDVLAVGGPRLTTRVATRKTVGVFAATASKATRTARKTPRRCTRRCKRVVPLYYPRRALDIAGWVQLSSARWPACAGFQQRARAARYLRNFYVRRRPRRPSRRRFRRPAARVWKEKVRAEGRRGRFSSNDAGTEVSFAEP